MAKRTRSQLEELARMAMAAGGGAIDETLFGLPTKYSEGLRELKEENPTSFGAGQLGSYLIPGTGLVGGASKLLKGLKGASNLAKEGKEASSVIKYLKNIVSSAASGTGEAVGQAGIRNMLGTSNSDLKEVATDAATFSTALGALSPVLGGAARKIYSHPSIYNPKSKNAKPLMEKLMEEGVVGGEGTFKRYSDKAKKSYNEILDPFRKKLSGEVVDFDEVVEKYAEREAKKKDTGLIDDLRQFNRTRTGAKNALSPDVEFDDLMDYKRTIDEELAQLQPAKRSAAIAPGSVEGSRAMAKDQALGSMRGSIENVEKRLLGDKFGQEGLDAMTKAKERYATGRELERALNRPVSTANLLTAPTAAGVLGTGGAALSGQPGPLMIGGGVAAATAAARTLPGRTALGVGLNRLTKPTGAAFTGRVTEKMNREEKKKQKEDKLKEDLEELDSILEE